MNVRNLPPENFARISVAAGTGEASDDASQRNHQMLTPCLWAEREVYKEALQVQTFSFSYK